MIGYKGFKKLDNGKLECRTMQYEIGMTYKTESEVKPCYSGFHFCKNLQDVFNYYPRHVNNAFGVIESSGKIIDEGNKSCCSEIKIIRLLSDSEIDKIIKEQEEERSENQVFNLDVVKQLQTNYNCYIGGSIGLYLHGFKLNRYQTDLDITLPFYQLIEKGGVVSEILDDSENKTSGSDFEDAKSLSIPGRGSVKMDIHVDPKQQYEFVEYKGFKYKVLPLYDILTYKMKYIKGKNGKKHQDDFKYMFEGKALKIDNKKESDYDI